MQLWPCPRSSPGPAPAGRLPSWPTRRSAADDGFGAAVRSGPVGTRAGGPRTRDRYSSTPPGRCASLPSPNMPYTWSVTRSTRYRSWLATTIVPGHESSRSSSDGQRVGVQVVGRLVEQQHVGLAGEQAQHLQAPPLAAGEVGDRRPDPPVGEPEHLGELRRGQLPVAELDPLGDLLDRLQQAQVAGQLGELLGQERGPDRLATGDRAAVRLAVRRRAGAAASTCRRRWRRRCAIRSPGPTCQVTSVSSGLSPAAQRDVVEVVDLPAEPGGGEPRERDRVPRRRHVGDQRVGGVDPELRLAGPGRRATAQPGDLLAQQVLPARLGLGRDPERARPGPASRRRSRPRRRGPSRRRPPRSACRPRRGTSGRG